MHFIRLQNEDALSMTQSQPLSNVVICLRFLEAGLQKQTRTTSERAMSVWTITHKTNSVSAEITSYDSEKNTHSNIHIHTHRHTRTHTHTHAGT